MRSAVKNMKMTNATPATITGILPEKHNVDISKLNEATKYNNDDGPTKSLLAQMKIRGNTPPADWFDAGGRGFRQLTSK